MAACTRDSDAVWLVSKASECLKTNCYAARCWLITAKTLFPEDFSIQFEAYCIEKSSRNTKEAACLLQDMFEKFPKEPRLQKEVQDISEAIQTDATDSEGIFLKDVFAAVPSYTQCQMLLKVSEDTSDILHQCRMMLILMTKFPQLVVEHGIPLIEKLISSEKHAHFPSCLNCYRKIMVDNVLPLVLAQQTINIPQKQVYRWLQKSIEFYVCYVAQPPNQANDVNVLSPDLKSPTRRTSVSSCRRTIVGLSEKEAHISKPWDRLHTILQLTGQKLEWPSIDVFNTESSVEIKFQCVRSLHERSLRVDSTLLKPVLYCATVLYLECCYNYTSRVEPQQFAVSGGLPGQQALILIEGLKKGDDIFASSPKLKKRKQEASDSSPIIKTSPHTQGGEMMVGYLLTAIKCWDLLHSSENIEKDYKKMAVYLKADTWKWMKLFEFDRLIYQGHFNKAIHKLMADVSNETRINLQLASCFYSLGRYSDACEKILAVITSLPQGSDTACAQQSVQSSSSVRQLQLLACTSNELLPYCIQLLLTCFKEKAFSNKSSDDLLGHLLVLLQYDWPKHEDLFEKVVAKISEQKTFVYSLFFTYIINIDILEEFAFLKSSESTRVDLDILPTSVKVLAQQRTVTRGVNKGVTEDFKVTIERQVARTSENIEQVIRQFLIEEKELLLLNLS